MREIFIFVFRSDIKGNQTSTSAAREDGSIGGIGARMMKMMGWTEGGGIGDRFKVTGNKKIKITFTEGRGEQLV